MKKSKPNGRRLTKVFDTSRNRKPNRTSHDYPGPLDPRSLVTEGSQQPRRMAIGRHDADAVGLAFLHCTVRTRENFAAQF